MTTYRLDELATVEISGVDKKTVDGETPVRLCNFVDVYHNWAITKQSYSTFMTATAKQAEIDKFAIKRGQVAITKDSETRDDIGVPTYMADSFDDVVLGYHCALITPNPERLSGAYLNALLHTDYAKKYFAANASGSGQRYTLSVETISSMPIPIPSIDEQNRIGKILSDIDKKICLNRVINDNLEAMAKQLYDYWFVQFDFPDANGRPYKSSGGQMKMEDRLKIAIPDNWEVETVKSVIQPISRGISYSSDQIISKNGYPMLNLACFSKQGEYRTGELKTFDGPFSETDKVYPFDMLIACTDMTQEAAVIGRPIFVTKEFPSFLYTMDLAKIDPLQVEKMYLYYTLRTPHYHRYIKPFASGTNVKHLNVKGVEDYLIIVPEKRVQLEFESLIRPIKEQQMELLNNSRDLQGQLDAVLPLLVNGQVRVD